MRKQPWEEEGEWIENRIRGQENLMQKSSEVERTLRNRRGQYWLDPDEIRERMYMYICLWVHGCIYTYEYMCLHYLWILPTHWKCICNPKINVWGAITVIHRRAQRGEKCERSHSQLNKVTWLSAFLPQHSSCKKCPSDGLFITIFFCVFVLFVGDVPVSYDPPSVVLKCCLVF